MQHRRRLPLDERLLAGAHRRHRGAGASAGRRRCRAYSPLRLVQRGPELQPELHAPHVRLRHHPGAGGHGQGHPQRARLQQPQGLLQAARDRRRRDQQPHDREAPPSARLLRRDGQRHRRHRHPCGARLRLPQHPRAHPWRGRTRLQAAHRYALPARPHLDRGRVTTSRTSSSRTRAWVPRTST